MIDQTALSEEGGIEEDVDTGHKGWRASERQWQALAVPEWMGERCAMAVCSQPDVERLCKIIIT